MRPSGELKARDPQEVLDRSREVVRLIFGEWVERVSQAGLSEDFERGAPTPAELALDGLGEDERRGGRPYGSSLPAATAAGPATLGKVAIEVLTCSICGAPTELPSWLSSMGDSGLDSGVHIAPIACSNRRSFCFACRLRMNQKSSPAAAIEPTLAALLGDHVHTAH